MRQITINIPDSFYQVFLDFFKHVPEATVVESFDFAIPEWHKSETLKRIETSKPEDFIPWEEAKKQLTFKTK